MPFSLPLYVGGNSVNSPKYAVLPAAFAPSSSTVNTLLVSGADAVGLNVKGYLVYLAEMDGMVTEAKTVPEADLSDTVTGPVYESDLAYREPL